MKTTKMLKVENISQLKKVNNSLFIIINLN